MWTRYHRNSEAGSVVQFSLVPQIRPTTGVNVVFATKVGLAMSSHKAMRCGTYCVSLSLSLITLARPVKAAQSSPHLRTSKAESSRTQRVRQCGSTEFSAKRHGCGSEKCTNMSHTHISTGKLCKRRQLVQLLKRTSVCHPDAPEVTICFTKFWLPNSCI